MRIKEIMSSDPVILSVSTTVQEAAEIFLRQEIDDVVIPHVPSLAARGTHPRSQSDKDMCQGCVGAWLAILERGLSFFDEGGHAFLLILGGENGVEGAPFEQQPLGQRGLERPVDALLGHHHRRAR